MACPLLLSGVMMGQDRRRHPRVDVSLDISVEVLGTQWQAKTVDLSPCGVKVALPAHWATLPPGTSVDVRLALPDGESPLALTAHVVRIDLDGVALNFQDLEAGHFERLKGFVDSALSFSVRKAVASKANAGLDQRA